jgi:hypothetical protein
MLRRSSQLALAGSLMLSGYRLRRGCGTHPGSAATASGVPNDRLGRNGRRVAPHRARSPTRYGLSAHWDAPQLIDRLIAHVANGAPVALDEWAARFPA